MNSRFLGLLASFLVGAGWAAAQPGPMTNLPLPPGNAATVNMPSNMPSLPQTPPHTGGPVYPAVPTLGDPVQNLGPAGPAGPGPDNDDLIIYGGVDYLLWQVENGRLPPTATVVPVGVITFDTSDLVTFSPTGTPAFAGTGSTGFAPASITNSSTFGAGAVTKTDAQHGIRVTAGFWVDPDMSFGIEASGIVLERGADAFAAVSSQGGNQFLINTEFNRQLFLIQGGTRTPLRTFDVFVAREVTSSLSGSTSNTLYGGEVNARCMGLRIGGFDFGGLAGFRYLSFNDQMTTHNNIRLFLPVGFTEDTGTSSLSRDLTFVSRDRTRVYNNFYGAQIGVDMDWKIGACFLFARAKLAVGNMHQTADVDSSTQVINNDPGQRSPAGYTMGGGLLASPVDNGQHDRDRIALIPEFNVKLGYNFTTWLRGYIGYDALELGSAARAGNLSVINTLSSTVTVTNSTNQFSVGQPTFRFQDSDVWIHGINCGFVATY